MKRNVGILVFDNAEVLDFAGPFEVFSVTLLPDNVKPFDVFCVAKNDNIISAVNGLQVKANYTVHNHPPIDILIISGGWGIRGVLDDPEIMEWIKNTIENCGLTLSICSAALALAKLGLLAGKPFCTHMDVYGSLYQIDPTAIPQKDKRFTRSDEKIYTSGGISAGIDLSFHIIETLFSRETALDTADYMEYNLQTN
ncbi:MAG: DJ-1/PfpI family protein [Ignavibacteria bacterium]|nr:DJ-1/PfpI family protein [Ignavibacteria bacterium]